VKIKSPKDLWAGIMFIAFGALFMGMALTNYQLGSAVRMGPGYFPTLLGGLLIFLGVLVLLGSLVIEGPKVPKFGFRPMIFVLAGCLFFAYTVKPLGVMLSIVGLVMIAAWGGHEFKWKEVLILGLVMAVFSVIVFVKGLTLPFPICPEIFENHCRF